MHAKHFARTVAGTITGGIAALALPVAAQDQRPQHVMLASDVYVERLGTANRMLEPAGQLLCLLTTFISITCVLGLPK